MQFLFLLFLSGKNLISKFFKRYEPSRDYLLNLQLAIIMLKLSFSFQHTSKIKF